jgi:broad specificity phosphatase PhoE
MMNEIAAGSYGVSMARALGELRGTGVHRTVAVIRHSAREFDPERHDLENPLTEHGRTCAQAFGGALPRDVFARAYASPVARCVETAALALDGHRAAGGDTGRHRTVEGLGLFYILDQMKMFRTMTSPREDEGDFMRDWFEGRMPPDIMMPPRHSAEIMVRLLVAKLEQQRGHDQPTLDLCVTHDLSIYLLKDRVLGLRHEQHGQVEFLDGLVVFERESNIWMWDHRVDPVPVKQFLAHRPDCVVSGV